VSVVAAVGVEGPLELTIDRDDVDVEDVAVAVEHVVEVIRDVVHDPEHPPVRGLRDPDVCGVENTEHIHREGLIVERGGDRTDEERADRVEIVLIVVASFDLSQRRWAEADQRQRFCRAANDRAIKLVALSGLCAILIGMSDPNVVPRHNDRTLPAALRERVATITVITDRVCEEHLDDEYAALSRTLTVRLARKRPSPLDRGEPRIWAAGVVYTVGSMNFLFDKSQPPYVRADKLAEHVGVVQSTMANKSARIRSLLGLSWYEPELNRRAILEQNPFAWMVTVNGTPFDARTLPDEIQEEARRLGLIPDLDSR
jgi:hypothetical protein